MVQANGENGGEARVNGHHHTNGVSHRRSGDGNVATSERRSWVERCLKRKPFEVVRAEAAEGVLERTLGFFDLFAIGVGGTVGSGVFVMTGLISHKLAGPAGLISWVVAGVGCVMNGTSFAEMSWRVPSSGGPYAYTFVALGEFPAALVGWCLTLEYGISGAAVAKSWGEMLSTFFGTDSTDSETSLVMGVTRMVAKRLGVGLGPEGVLDLGGLYGAILQTCCVFIVIGGLKTSKFTVNVFSFAKALLVVFMIIAALTIFKRENLMPFSPFGASGVLKASVSAFFGYLGFDEMVLLAPETKDPAKNIPRALFSSLFVVISACCVASLSLSGALPAPDIDSDSAFAELFREKGLDVAHQITAIGELVTLPIVVLITFMAQPRLLFAMAKDGLMPRLFAEVDSHGNLAKGSLASGVICVMIAALVPFDSLDDLISAGVLMAFNFVTSSLLVLRHSASIARPVSTVGGSMIEGVPLEKNSLTAIVERVLLANVFAAIGGALASYGGVGNLREGILMVGAISSSSCCMLALSVLKCAPVNPGYPPDRNFRAPFFPWLQGASLVVNWFLLWQLPPDGLFALGGYMTIAVGHYVLYGASHSVANCSGWSLVLGTAEGANGGRRTSGGDVSSFSALSSRHGMPNSEGADVPLLGRRGSGEYEETKGDGDDLDRSELGSEAAEVTSPTPSQTPSRTPSVVYSSEKAARRRPMEGAR